MAIFVTKANGSKQEFDREKIIQTCLRLGASHEVALQVAQKVENKIYEGISTKKVLRIVLYLMRKHKPAVHHLFDLKQGISLMEPKPEFEVFIRFLLGYSGFRVKPNVVLRGLCGEHEVDGIAVKDGLTFFVETKHHSTYHSLTGLDESRIARAILEDVSDAYAQGLSQLKIDRAMIVTNTRYSEHAKNYGSCRNILQVGWASPERSGIRDIVEKYKLYPLSCIRGLNLSERRSLVLEGVVVIKQLLELDAQYIERRIGLSHETTLSIIEKARHVSETLWH